VKHLLYEQQNMLSELKAESVVSTKQLEKEKTHLAGCRLSYFSSFNSFQDVSICYAYSTCPFTVYKFRQPLNASRIMAFWQRQSILITAATVLPYNDK